MKVESSVKTIEKNSQYLYEKMQNVANFEKLMPDNLQHFSVLDENSFAFALNGMPQIQLQKGKEIPYNELNFNAKEGKIPFELKLLLKETEPEKTQVQFVFEGNFNPMMALMVKSPITKLIETMAERFSSL